MRFVFLATLRGPEIVATSFHNFSNRMRLACPRGSWEERTGTSGLFGGQGCINFDTGTGDIMRRVPSKGGRKTMGWEEKRPMGQGTRKAGKKAGKGIASEGAVESLKIVRRV